MGNSSENIHDPGGSNPSGYSSLTGQNAEISSFARRIQNKYKSYPWSPLLKKESIKFIKELVFFLFPHFSGGKYSSTKEILLKLESLKRTWFI